MWYLVLLIYTQLSFPEFLFGTKIVIMSSNLSAVILNWLCQFHFLMSTCILVHGMCAWFTQKPEKSIKFFSSTLYLNGRYRQLWDVKWMLGIKPGSFERIGSSCKCWAISADPVCQYQIYKFCIYVHHENRSVVFILFVWGLYLVWNSRYYWLQKKN